MVLRVLSVLLLCAGCAISGAARAADGGAPIAGRKSMGGLLDPSLDADARLRRARALGSESSVASLDELVDGLRIADEKLTETIIASLKKRSAGNALLERALDAKAPTGARVGALGGVRALKPKDAAARLTPLLDPKKTPDTVVREAAAHALCAVEPAAAEVALVQSLKTEPSAGVRFFVALALGELKTPDAKSAVANALKTEKDFTVLDSLERSARKHAAP
jgi:HEAT repeats